MNLPNEPLTRTTINRLDLDAPNVMITALLIGKQEHRRFKPMDYANAAVASTEERGVWNFTIRDSPIDYINVTFWGKAETVSHLDTVLTVGSLVEISRPRVSLRAAEDSSEQYRPGVTSPYHLTINEDVGNVQKVRHYSIKPLMELLHLPTKPMFNYTTIDYLFSNIHTINGLLFDLLVAVRHIGEVRIVQTKNGLREVRKIIVFDSTNPAMAITFWNPEFSTRASLWKPRETILFITDCKIQYEAFSKSATGTPSMKSIITENPEGREANVLREYAKNVPLQSSAVMDQMLGIMPDVASIKTVMNIRQICEKIDTINKANSARLEDNQFAVVLYGNVTHLDLDGVTKIFSTRCSLCKSLINETNTCQNEICLSNTSNQEMEMIKTFDLRLQVADRTGTLPSCRLSGQNAENVFHCTPAAFEEMSDDEKYAIKWTYLLEFCELRLVILVKNNNPLITVLSLERANVATHGMQ